MNIYNKIGRKTFCFIIACTLQSLLFTLPQPRPLQLVQKKDSDYLIGVPGQSIKKYVIAKKIDNQRNNLGIDADDICAYARIAVKGVTQGVVVCKSGAIFNNVKKHTIVLHP